MNKKVIVKKKDDVVQTVIFHEEQTMNEWIKSVWVEYYTRKAMISLESELNLDFSVCGPIPFTVPELMEEVSV